MSKKPTYKIKSRIWITDEDGLSFLGEGRIKLLQQIDKHGSISGAAKEMKMSYKKAWELVASMNSHKSGPLVTQKVGGAGGGGSALSDSGRNAIKLFNELNESNKAYLDEKVNLFHL